jgi:hypothetical protein
MIREHRKRKVSSCYGKLHIYAVSEKEIIEMLRLEKRIFSKK